MPASKQKSSMLFPAHTAKFKPHLMVLVAGVVAAIGISTLVASHASTVNSFSNKYLSVAPLAATVTSSRKTPNYDMMTADGAGYTTGMIYGEAFTITNKTAGAYQFIYNEPTNGVGFAEASGGMMPGQTVKIHTYVNSNKPNGVYTGSATLQYYATDKNAWVNGPTVTYSITLVDYYYTDYITASSLTQTHVFSRKAVDKNTGLISYTGLKLTSKGATQFNIYDNQPTQGVGYNTVSGGLSAGMVQPIQLYINPNKPNGTYTGTATLKYFAPDLNQMLDGPTLTYNFTLVDSYYTDVVTLSDTSVDVTLSRANAQSGFIYGPGFTINNKTAVQYDIYPTPDTPGVGWYDASGGLQAHAAFPVRMYVNTNKPNGVYKGTAIFKYQDPATGVLTDGPAISYKITLTN